MELSFSSYKLIFSLLYALFTVGYSLAKLSIFTLNELESLKTVLYVIFNNSGNMSHKGFLYISVLHEA